MPSGLAVEVLPFTVTQGEVNGEPSHLGKEDDAVMLSDPLPVTGEGSPPPETMSVMEAPVPTGAPAPMARGSEMESVAFAARELRRVQVKPLPPDFELQLQPPETKDEVFTLTPEGNVPLTVKVDPSATVELVFVISMVIWSALSPCLKEEGLFINVCDTDAATTGVIAFERSKNEYSTRCSSGVIGEALHSAGKVAPFAFVLTAGYSVYKTRPHWFSAAAPTGVLKVSCIEGCAGPLGVRLEFRLSHDWVGATTPS